MHSFRCTNKKMLVQLIASVLCPLIGYTQQQLSTKVSCQYKYHQDTSALLVRYTISIFPNYYSTQVSSVKLYVKIQCVCLYIIEIYMTSSPSFTTETDTSLGLISTFPINVMFTNRYGQFCQLLEIAIFGNSQIVSPNTFIVS